MLGPPEIVTVAEPDWLEFSELVAVMVIRSGEGAASGAVYRPVASMPPQAPARPHAAPEIVHITSWLSVPVTPAVNRNWPPLAIVALPGKTLTRIWGRIVTLEELLFVESAWLVAVTVTGLGEGRPDGAR